MIATKDYGLTGIAPGCSVNNVWTGYYTTFDGGRTWLEDYAPGYRTGPASPISKYPCSTDGVISVDGEGTFYLSGLAYTNTGSTSAVWVAKSRDGGRTFPDLAIADETNFDDKNWIAVDLDRRHVYVTWTLFNSGSGIYLRRALDGDIHAFEPRVRLCSASCGSAQGSFPVVAADGTVYVIWTDVITGGVGGIYLVKSTDFGKTFTAERRAVTITASSWSDGNAYRTPTIPHFAVSHCDCATRGHLYLVWQDARNGDSDAYFSKSTDGGTTWSAAIRLNDDALHNGRPQYFPTIAVDPADGRLHVSFIDRRDDPGNYLLNAYYVQSKDDGVSWSPNQRLSTVSWDPKYSKHQNGAVFIGDYHGIVARDGVVRPVWPDTRNLRSDVFTAAAFAHPSVSAALPPHLNVSVQTDATLDVGVWTALASGRAELDLPKSWDIVDAGGAEIVPGADVNTLVWSFGEATDDKSFRWSVIPRKASVFDLVARVHWEIAGDPAASGTVRSNRTVLVSYPVLQIQETTQAKIVSGEPTNVTIRVQNVGYGPLTNATVVLDFTADFTPLPEGVGAINYALGRKPDASDPAALLVSLVGPAYGKPLSDASLPPAAGGAPRVTWTIPTLEKQTSLVYHLTLLANPRTDGKTYSFVASVTGDAPDGAALLKKTAAQTGKIKAPSPTNRDEATAAANALVAWAKP